MKGILVLEDGRVFEGVAFGAPGQTTGEVVFNTGMTGYQEVLTDASYCGQIVTMTYPLIGNYGVNPLDFEFASGDPQVRGFIVKELCDQPSHFQADQSLNQYLLHHGITGLAGIDTRALTRHLRIAGTMKGVLATRPDETVLATDAVAALAAEARSFDMHNHVAQVTTREAYHLPGEGKRVVVIDTGLKQNILRSMHALGLDLHVVPANAAIGDILALRPDGVHITNGPGDPADATATIQTLKDLIAYKQVPLFGICLGHQLMAHAFGAGTYKLKYGHRGANHPVKDLATGRVYITSQNHGYAVDAASAQAAGLQITHKNLNDDTVEGLRHESLPVFTVQYHPEAHPGPEENRYLFDRFLALMA